MKQTLTNLVLLLLMGAFWLAAGASYGQEPSYPLNTAGVQYYITGVANNADDGTSANGKTVRLHPLANPDFNIAEAPVTNNQYIINAFATYVIPAGIYQVSIRRATPTDYGAGPAGADVTLTGKGWDEGPALTLTLNGGPGPVEITTAALLPNAIAGQLYFQTLLVQGGLEPHVWSFVDALPAGLSDWLELYGAGVLSGTPKAANVGGPYTFTVKAESPGSFSSGTKAFTLWVQAEGVVAGAVPLTIDREGNHVKIGWSTSNPPNIYYLPGNGNGQFRNQFAGDPLWTKIDNLAALPAGFSHSPTNTEKYILHNNQVGKTEADGANKEVYYKAFASGLTADQILAIFTEAPAVGKVDYTFKGGNNFFNYPFAKQNLKVNQISGSNCFNASGQSIDFPAGSRVYLHSYDNGNFDASEFNGTTKTWSDLNLNSGAGNIFYNSSADDIRITLTGNVLTTAAPAMTAKGGNNLISLVYPKGALITFFTNAKSGDRLLIRNEAGSFDVIDNTKVNNVDTWGNPNYQLTPNMGYWYYRDPSNGNMEWGQNLP